MKTKPHPDSRLTLRQCFERYYRDSNDLTHRTKQKYDYDLKRWERLTGNPPISAIDNDLVAKFRGDCIAEGLSAETINGNWANVKAILRMMAPPLLGNPRGRNVIPSLPYMLPCRVIRKAPRRISIDDLNRTYLCLEYATHPKIGFPPADWWRCLLVVGYFTGLRKGDLLSLRQDQFDLQEGTLTFSASKTAKPDIFPLHPVALTHLRSAWLPERDRFFRGQQGRGSRMYDIWRELLAKGEVSYFTFHDIRRTAASEIERVRPGMAKVFLQHAARDVTGRNYLNMSEELREAIHAMRIPETFEYGPRISGEISGRMRDVRQRAASEFLTPPPRGTDPSDWQFRLGSFCYRGTWFRISGDKARALRALAMSEEPLEYRRMATVIVGPDYDPAEPLVRARTKSVIYQVRRYLRDAFGLPDDWNPVICTDRTDAAWTISLPPAEMIGGHQ